MSERITGKAPLLSSNALVPEGTASMMGEGHPLTPSMERLSAGTGGSAAEMKLWAREVERDAAWCRRELQAINRENRAKYGRR
jgi:hypothetical protein